MKKFIKKRGIIMKKVSIAAIIISVVAICLSCASFIVAQKPAKSTEGDIQYVVFLGTNDKDTNDPVFTPEEAANHADAVLTKHFSGFTIQEAKGGWVNDDGSVAHEYTLVIYLSDTDLDTVHAAAKDLVDEFNQSAVMIQSNLTTTEFYSGDN